MLTAVSVYCSRTDELHGDLSITRVKFRSIEPREMHAYWASGEPVGKAGSYAIQGRGAIFVTHIVGSYSGVVGLPLAETAGLLKQCGVEVLA